MAPHEAELFFPQLPGDSFLNTWEWIDPTEWGAPGWPAAVAAKRPAVIVTSWSTPRIPDELVEMNGGSVAYVCNVVGSVRKLVTRAQIAAGLKVSNWGPIAAPMVAEHALLLVLAALRKMGGWPKCDDPDLKRRFDSFDTKTLHGKKVGIFGFGAIARALIPLLRPFATKVSAYSVGCDFSAIAAEGVDAAGSLRELFAGAEVLICCESLTERSRGCINAELLTCLPLGATFVNVGRGAIVREADLARVAVERALRVASDVFEREPLPPSSPLWQIPGIIVSPHIGGPTVDRAPSCGDRARHNVGLFLEGCLPEGLITEEIFDRST